jgi:hypothetical protein
MQKTAEVGQKFRKPASAGFAPIAMNQSFPAQ